jgi:putative membrane protein insertion efficiency factor
MKFIKVFSLQVRFVVLLVIKLYQKTLSFDHGPLAKVFPFFGCRYHPTCSEYAYQAIDKYGVFKGSWLSVKRVIRCHPLAKGGYDPVP